MTNSIHEANAYVRRIRNQNKRVYARTYLEWRLKGEQGVGPDYRDISYMAAQGVRMQLDAILAA